MAGRYYVDNQNPRMVRKPNGRVLSVCVDAGAAADWVRNLNGDDR